MVLTAPSTEDPEGEWRIIDGKVDNLDRLASNIYLVTTGVGKNGFRFRGIGEQNAVMGPALYKGYLTKGSLNLIVEPKTQEELFCGLHPGDPDCDGLDLNYPSPNEDLEASVGLPIIPCADDDFCLIGTEQPEGSFCPAGESFVNGECSKPGNEEPNLIEMSCRIRTMMAAGCIDPKPDTPCKAMIVWWEMSCRIRTMMACRM